MRSKRLFQIFVLLVMLFSPFGNDSPARAIDQLDQDVIQDQPIISISVSSTSISVGGAATVTVNLNHVPPEGYTSAELTCYYSSDLLEPSDIFVTNRFGPDPAVAVSSPYPDRFIVAIAGSHDNKATTDGTVFTFDVQGLQPGQALLECQARVSKGDHVLTTIASTGGNVIVLGNALTPTVDPAICDKVQLIADVTVPDGTSFPPGATFTKTWRLKNAGSCTWTTSYQLVFFSGEQMSAPSSANFSTNVEPGEIVDISLNMTAPSVAGSYRGYWMFKNANGALFGIGLQANRPWWVDIRVSGATVTPTIQPAPCDKAEFIADINVPHGTVISPGAQFTKTWRLKNVGSCTWTPSYRMALLSGDQMGAPSSIQLPVNVAPGQTVDLSLNLTAPLSAGSYRGYWIFQNSTGAPFGIGSQGNQPWFVDIVVANATVSPTPTQSPVPLTPTETPGESTATPTPTPSITPGGPTATPLPGTVYDFAANACAATWFSGAGQRPCPGVDGDPRGFVLRLSNPQLETGAIDTRPGLLTFPQNVQNGYIQGFYPPFHVQNGDRFRSTISCEGGATNCYVAFRLDYQIGADPIRTFWGPWLERYDGKYYSVDIDLSSLAGQDVKFILTVLSAGTAIGDRALWVGPIMYRAGSNSTTTSEVSLTPTAEVSPTFTPTSTMQEGSPTPTELTGTPAPAVGLLTGTVFASKLVRIEAYNADNNLVGAGWTNSDGSFEFYAPSGTNSVIAMANGFLSAQRLVTITDASTTTLPTITLIAGDIDNNDVIDQFDALTIGMGYNTATPSSADLNNDGIINVLDLELLARNYRRTGPVDWE